MGLAILGDTPQYEQPLYLVRPGLPGQNDFVDIYNNLNISRNLTNNGVYVKSLESELASYLHVRHAVVTSSGTMGLMLLLMALDLKGDVILPSFTFVGTAHSVRWQNLRLVFADIEPDYFTIDPAKLERLLTPQTVVVMGVHLFGNPCDIDGLRRFTDRHQLRLIFDSCQAMGSRYQGVPIGSFGEAEVFSLHATKIIHTFEGGVITTNDDTLAKRLMRMRDFGFTGYDRVEMLGINGKMNEMCAAVGLKNLADIEQRIAANKRNHEVYRDLLRSIPGIYVPDTRPGSEINYNVFPVLIRAEDFGLGRDELIDIFWKENIIVRKYFYPGCHRQPPYLQEGMSGGHLNVTEEIAEGILCLPCFPDLGEENIKMIVGVFREAFERKDEIKRNLSFLVKV